jgi:hypothetical protein
MVEHNCGVRVENTFVLMEVDEDFFDESQPQGSDADRMNQP